MKQRRVKTDPQLYIHLIYNRDDTGQRIVLKKKKITTEYPYTYRIKKGIEAPISHHKQIPISDGLL